MCGWKRRRWCGVETHTHTHTQTPGGVTVEVHVAKSCVEHNLVWIPAFHRLRHQKCFSNTTLKCCVDVEYSTCETASRLYVEAIRCQVGVASIYFERPRCPIKVLQLPYKNRAYISIAAPHIVHKACIQLG